MYGDVVVCRVQEAPVPLLRRGFWLNLQMDQHVQIMGHRLRERAPVAR